MHMTARNLLAGLILVSNLVVGIAQAAPYIDPVLQPLWTQANTGDKRPIVIIVMFKDAMQMPNLAASQATRPWTEAALRQNAMVSQKATLDRIQGFIAGGTQVNGIQLWLMNGIVLQLPVGKMTELANDPNVTAIYANHDIKLVAPGRGRIRADGKFTWGTQKIGVPDVRARTPNMIGTGIRVGILDTGIDAAHPDLKDRTIGFKDFINSRPQPYDDQGHGTHVAGTVSGGEASGESIGVAPGVKLVVGKILNASGSGTWAGVLAGMQWIADPDGNPQTPDQPHLVSNSWGGGGPSASKDPMDEPLCKATAGWAKLGILPVFANGNSGPGAGSVGLPAACPHSLAVGATNDKDGAADFSSRGPAKWKTVTLIKPDVSAPGVDVKSSTPGGKYDSWSGTSMATPHVAGLASLVYQVNPQITYEQARALLMTRALHLGEPGHNNTFGMGRIDAPNTLKAIMNWGRSFVQQIAFGL